MIEITIISFYKLQRQGSLGDLLFSISYLPTAERLTVVIMKARNLKTMDISGSAGKSMDSRRDNFTHRENVFLDLTRAAEQMATLNIALFGGALHKKEI